MGNKSTEEKYDFTQVQQNKLTDWPNEPTLSELKDNFNDCKNSHDDWVSKVRHWRDLMEVSGSEKPLKIKGRSSVQPKLILRQAGWRHSAMSEPFLSSEKIFQVNPRTFEDVEAARQNELILNWQFSTVINKVKFIDELVRVVVDEGTAVVRVGWDRQTEMVEEQEPVYNFTIVEDPTLQQQILIQLQKVSQLKKSNPREFNESVTDEIKESLKYFEETGQIALFSIVEYNTVKKEKIKVNRPFFKILNPENVYIDPSCDGDFSKALFVINSFETNYAELNSSGLYTNLDKINWYGLKNTDPFHENTYDENYNFRDKPRKKVIAYEYWGMYDIYNENKLVPFVATWIDDVLIRMDLNPFPDEKLPFVVIPYLPIKRSIYGEPDATLLEENQKILGAITRGMIDLLGMSANAQRGFAKGFLDTVNKRKFERGEDYEFNGAMGVGGSYIEHGFPPLSDSAFNMSAYMNQDAEALTGVKSFSGGISSEAYGQVATGIRGVLDASGKREMAILRRFIQGLKEIAEKVIAMNYIFLSDEEVVRVTNSEFISIKREDLKGNFDLVIDISTTEIDNSKAQDLTFLLQTIGPAVQDINITLLLLSKFADLKRMPDLAEKLRRYEPQPNPMQDMQVKKVESEINVNQAKAANLQSEAAATNLNTQQEASGLNHEKEKELRKIDQRGKRDLAITQAALAPQKMNELPARLEKGIGYNEIASI